MALLFSTANALAFSHIVLDASNLQLGLRPGLSVPSLSSLDVPRLAERMDVMTRLLTERAGGGDAPGETLTTAIFDGSAFDGLHAGTEWTCDPEAPEASPVTVRFTDARVSADDAVVAFTQEIGSVSEAPRAEPSTTGHARSVLEQPLAAPRPIFAVTLLKSAMGKGKRDKREAFLRTVGLTKMGDTVHLPAYDDTLQDRSLNLIRGLHSLERGIVRIEKLTRPTMLVVSDDRGLRRRCIQLAHPPVVRLTDSTA